MNFTYYKYFKINIINDRKEQYLILILFLALSIGCIMTKKNNMFSAVTTFNLNKQPFGLEMIESFYVNWPDNITLTAFIEGSNSIDSTKVSKKILIVHFCFILGSHDPPGEFLKRPRGPRGSS